MNSPRGFHLVWSWWTWETWRPEVTPESSCFQTGPAQPTRSGCWTYPGRLFWFGSCSEWASSGWSAHWAWTPTELLCGSVRGWARSGHQADRTIWGWYRWASYRPNWDLWGSAGNWKPLQPPLWHQRSPSWAGSQRRGCHHAAQWHWSPRRQAETSSEWNNQTEKLRAQSHRCRISVCCIRVKVLLPYRVHHHCIKPLWTF